VRTILMPFTGQAISRRAFDAAVRLAQAEHATLMPAFLARVPRTLPIESALPAQCSGGMPLLEAIEQQAAAQGLEVDSRVARGRTYRDALRRLLEQEQFDRVIVSATDSPPPGPDQRGSRVAAGTSAGRGGHPPACPGRHQARCRGPPPRALLRVRSFG
jgi:nucleotide-binding universal stress UspA family protein